ncbi:MAG: sigma-54-dependent Fis family transcriptional regulator [Bacteroidales bacterium]|nr:sigma-54-dependent Fis family transcriptional regulator [Bacteroidales bacterium]
MKKILFTWLATINDFDEKGQISTIGPNVNMHAYHWEYDQHIILYTRDYLDSALQLLHYLKAKFSNHKVNIRKLDINEVYTDLASLKNKIETLLFEYSDWKIDLLLSTGTGLMKIAWYICHTNLNLNTRLLKVLSPVDSRDFLQPELYVIDVEQSPVPVSALIRETNILSNKISNERIITKTLEQTYDRAFKIAQADNVSVLILGNTGTGKEVLAKYIHYNSARKHKPFISVNCSAFSEQLLESRLFGHKKGSFTGAYNNAKGVFEQADGGTVFLDEIGDINTYMQQAILRFLQEKEIQPIGANPKKIDVRIIAATNKDIQQAISENKFRADLFFRLGITLELPDFIRYKNDEKLEIINFFLEQKRIEFGRKKIIKIEETLKSFLFAYQFPGNIRELINIIDNLYVFAENNAELSDLPLYVNKINSDFSLKLADVEREHIKKVLKLCNNNKSQAANTLGIALNTLKNKIND